MNIKEITLHFSCGIILPLGITYISVWIALLLLVKQIKVHENCKGKRLNERNLYEITVTFLKLPISTFISFVIYPSTPLNKF